MYADQGDYSSLPMYWRRNSNIFTDRLQFILRQKIKFKLKNILNYNNKQITVTIQEFQIFCTTNK